MRFVALAVVAVLALQGCSRSSDRTLDPRSWFGSPDESIPAPGEIPVFNEVDTRILVAQVREVRIDPTPGGVIVRAEGLASTQAYWDADIVRANRPDGPSDLMRYEFRVRPPATRQPVGSEQSRLIEVADFISNTDLDPIRRISVVAATNTVSRSR